MLNKNNFFNKYYSNSKKFKKNLKQTKFFFNSLVSDVENFKIPLLNSYEKNYEFGFSEILVKNFSKYKNIVIFGMGGSILGTKSIYSFFKKRIKKQFFFFDNLDTDLHLKYKKIKNLKNSCFIIVSKSGNTIETLSNVSAVFSKILPKNKLIVITESTDNNLMKFAIKNNAEIIEHKKFIGGRYSVLSEAAMFPAALMGLDLKKFKNLKVLIKNKSFASSLIENVANIYTFCQKGINNSIVLSYDVKLNDLGYWYQQLVGESLGKQGKGINPILSNAPKDHHSLLQLYLDGPRDKFFTFFNSTDKANKLKFSNIFLEKDTKFLRKKSLRNIVDKQCDAVKNIFKLKKIPYREITFKNTSEEELGKVFTFFVLETILLSRLLKINPFSQPAVEQVKIETKRLLK